MTVLRATGRARERRAPAETVRHRGDADHRHAPAAHLAPRLAERTMCEICGSVYLHKTWRRGRRRLAFTPPFGVKWAVCPACRQVTEGRAQGRVLLRGPGAFVLEDAIRTRVVNVADRAGHTQPERRLVAMERAGDALEVLTTSQKLAHRIVRELLKAFGGRARYAWDERDGSLHAIWQLERERRDHSPRTGHRRHRGRR